MRQSNRDFQGKILGTCILEKPIGHGGMSVVYLARQKKPERHVAVKIVQPEAPIEHADYSTFLTRFQREADIIAKLEHINIIPIFEYGEQEEMAYLVMPYASGGNFSQLLKQQGKFSAIQAMKYLQQAADALDYAHAHNIIHRDLKPSNFLLYADKRLVLADFGIAQMTRGNNASNELTLTPAGVLMGTPEYIAPEMWQGRLVDHRTDIYALGIILFQMLSGELPFQGSEPFAIAYQHLNKPLPLLHTIDPAIPWKIDTVLQKATAKEKDARYESAGQFSKAFLSAITSSEKNTYHNVPSILTKETSLTPMEPLPYKHSVQISEAQNEAPAQQYHQASSIETTESDAFSPTHPISPNTTSRKRRHSQFRRLKALFIIILLFGISFITLHSINAFAGHSNISVINTTPAASPTLTPTQQAEALIQQYYNDINQRKYVEAYSLLTPAFQHSLSYENFAKGYALTIHDDIVFNSVQIRLGGNIEISVTIHAAESMNNGIIKNTYAWDSTVTHQDGKWEISGATTTKM